MKRNEATCHISRHQIKVVFFTLQSKRCGGVILVIHDYLLEL